MTADGGQCIGAPEGPFCLGYIKGFLHTRCRYRAGYLWGVLAGWQRPVGDALVHLGTERRGCLSLPDADCCYLPVGGLRWLTRTDRRLVASMLLTSADPLTSHG